MKLFLWIYAVVGSLYNVMYMIGNELVAKYAVGPFYLLMMASTIVLTVLVVFSIATRLGVFEPK